MAKRGRRKKKVKKVKTIEMATRSDGLKVDTPKVDVSIK